MRVALPAALTALSIASSAGAQTALVLPEPTAPEPRVIEEQGVSPVYYRTSPRFVLPLARIGVGYHGRLPINGFEGGSAFSADFFGGAVIRVGRAARAGVLTELGYSYATFSEHLMSLGIGVVYGIGSGPKEDPRTSSPSPGFRLAVVPHAVAGHAYGGGSFGARSSILLGYWFYAVEIAHQYLLAPPGNAHEIHVMLTSVSPFGENE